MIYYLALASAHVMGSIPLPVSSFNSAKALGKAWKLALSGSYSTFTFKITNEKGENLWTL